MAAQPCLDTHTTLRPVFDLPNLDSLRSVAVLLVVIDHLVPTLTHKLNWEYLPLSEITAHIGQIGVIAFFVHTSLVLMYSIDRLKGIGTSRAIQFYIRRAFRIYPLAICSIILAVCFGIPAVTWREPEAVTWAVVCSNILLVQNFWTKQSVIGPLWSLPYEVQMYAVLPLMHWVACKNRAVVYLTMVGVVAMFFGVILDLKWGKLNLAAYIPCFVAGVLCFSLSRRQRRVLPSWLWLPFLLIGIGVYCLVHLGKPYPIYWVGWIFAFVLGVCINSFRQARSHKYNAITLWIATYSYGVYLWHVPVLYLIFDLIKVAGPLVGSLLLLPITFGASILSYHLIEAPMISLGRKIGSGPMCRTA